MNVQFNEVQIRSSASMVLIIIALVSFYWQERPRPSLDPCFMILCSLRKLEELGFVYHHGNVVIGVKV